MYFEITEGFIFCGSSEFQASSVEARDLILHIEQSLTYFAIVL